MKPKRNSQIMYELLLEYDGILTVLVVLIMTVLVKNINTFDL